MTTLIVDLFGKFFKFRKKETYVVIKEGGMGLECFSDDELIKRLQDSHREQLKAFITSILKSVGGEKKSRK